VQIFDLTQRISTSSLNLFRRLTLDVKKLRRLKTAVFFSPHPRGDDNRIRETLIKSAHDATIRERIEQLKASVRAKVEHPFRVVKRQFGFTKVRYRGLAKKTARLHTLFALSNLWMARRHLLFTG
jgi:hypothetical protein